MKIENQLPKTLFDIMSIILSDNYYYYSLLVS